MIIKTCRHCGDDFPVRRFGQNREHCYSKACIELEVLRKKIEVYKLRNLWTAKEKLKVKPMCKCCKIRPIKPGNKYLCEICFSKADKQIEMYCGWGVDIQQII